MKHRLARALPTATAIVLSVLLIGLGMRASGAYFTDQVTVEGLSVQAGYWVTPTATPTPVQLAATVVITPNMLKKNDTGPITARITPPTGYSVGDIDTSSILLCVGTALCSSGIQPTSTSSDTTYLDAVFDREAILDLLRSIELPSNGRVYLAVSGWVGSAVFVGSDEVQVQKGALDTAAQMEPAAAAAIEPSQAAPGPSPTATETPTPTPSASEAAPPPSPTPAATPTMPAEGADGEAPHP